MKIHALDLEVTGIGMVTSVGHDAQTACAAIRAGISRASPIHEYMTASIADHESIPLLGHPVVPITNGFASVGRWLQLCRHALRDLQSHLADLASRRSTVTYVWLPELGSARFEHDDAIRPERMREAFVDRMLATAPFIREAGPVEIRALGRAGFAALLAEASDVLRSVAQRVVIVAVDSYVDPYALLWLGQAHRLKHDHNPVGLAPGETAVAMSLELGNHCPVRITQAGEAHDESNDVAARRGLGRVLAMMLDEHVKELYTDLNGEPWRAQAHGFALTALSPQLVGELKVHHVAAELGDTGEASALLNLGLATRSFQRGYARGRAALVAANAEDGAVAGVRLERNW